jgi:hypothetical protein
LSVLKVFPLLSCTLLKPPPFSGPFMELVPTFRSTPKAFPYFLVHSRSLSLTFGQFLLLC